VVPHRSTPEKDSSPRQKALSDLDKVDAKPFPLQYCDWHGQGHDHHGHKSKRLTEEPAPYGPLCGDLRKLDIEQATIRLLFVVFNRLCLQLCHKINAIDQDIWFSCAMQPVLRFPANLVNFQIKL
jgi:hypothetical protein